MKLSRIYNRQADFTMKKRKILLFFRKFIVSALFLFSFTHCYYNPFVYSLLNPQVEEDEKAGFLNLGILAILNSGPKTFSISGIVRNDSGIPQSNKSFTIVSSQSTELGLDTGGTTNSTGRFFIRVGLGATKIDVLDGVEPLVSFTLNVSDGNSIQVTDINPTNYDIGGLASFDPNNQPNFFDVLNTTPVNNSTGAIFSDLIVSFSRNLETVESGSEASWFSANIVITPSVSLNSSSFSPSGFIVMISGYTGLTDYTVEFKNTIKSEDGNQLTPYTLRFQTNNP